MFRRSTPSADTHEEAAISRNTLDGCCTDWHPERTALVARLRLLLSAVPRVVADGMDRMASTVIAGLEIDGSRHTWLVTHRGAKWPADV